VATVQKPMNFDHTLLQMHNIQVILFLKKRNKPSLLSALEHDISVDIPNVVPLSVFKTTPPPTSPGGQHGFHFSGIWEVQIKTTLPLQAFPIAKRLISTNSPKREKYFPETLGLTEISLKTFSIRSDLQTENKIKK